MTDAHAFYEPDREGRFVAAAFTRGPWDPRMQHGGPPSALLARALTDADPVEGQQLARVTFELLRPIPIGPVRVRTDVPRPGRRVSMATAVLTEDDGTELVLARAWRMQPTPADLAETAPAKPPASLDEAGETEWLEDNPPTGFADGVEVRFARGSFRAQGPATAWFRLRIPLVAGTSDRPTDLVFVTADCGNGISGAIDYRRYVFINTDLTVHLERLPTGDWICLDAETAVAPGGVTFATSTLFDEAGRLGRGAQTLYVAQR